MNTHVPSTTEKGDSPFNKNINKSNDNNSTVPSPAQCGELRLLAISWGTPQTKRFKCDTTPLPRGPSYIEIAHNTPRLPLPPKRGHHSALENYEVSCTV